MASGPHPFRICVLTSHQQTETEFLNLVHMLDCVADSPLEVRDTIVRQLGLELTSAFQGHLVCGRPTIPPQTVHFNISVHLCTEGGGT